MEFSPQNAIVQLCLKGMALENAGNQDAATQVFHQAWESATHDLEKFLAAFYIGRQPSSPSYQLKWYETALEFAEKQGGYAMQSAFPTLHTHIGQCYQELGNSEKANHHFAQRQLLGEKPADKGPFYHGTRADLGIGDLLNPGGISNYKDGFQMNHIYFTALPNGAGLAAALAKGDGRERVYIIEPTGEFEHDPNLTDKKFPGNLTRSYRSAAPLRIVGEMEDWAKQTTQNIQQWKEKLAKNEGEIIN